MCPVQAGAKRPEPGTEAKQGMWGEAGVAAWNHPVRWLKSLIEKTSPDVFLNKKQNT